MTPALFRAVSAARAELGPELFDVVRRRVHAGLGLEPETRADSAVAAFVDQFVLYVPGIDEELRANMAAESDVDQVTFADACWAVDQATRLDIAADRLLDPDERPSAEAEDTTLSLAEAAREHHASAARLSALDPVTTELVRLRCAHHHVCGICMNHRLAVAGHAVIDEALVPDIARFEQSALAERHKVALRYADAHMISPAEISDSLRGQVRAHFTPEEIVELMLDVSAWSRQKAKVALGKAGAPNEVKLLEFDANGYQLAS